MTRPLRLALLAFALGASTLAVAPASHAAAPVPFEEVAQAANPAAAASRQRTRRQRADRPRTNRQQAQRSRRPRANQG